MSVPAQIAQSLAVAAGTNIARNQANYSALQQQPNNGDWRLRLSLAPGSNYLYNSGEPGILQPLQVTNGVIFPYTPTIDVKYSAVYQQQSLTHSNYKGYYYQSSEVGPIGISCVFTAQDVNEANYLLAVIHFFRSATRMFYGQDTQRGAPPPLLYLNGLGQYQFSNQACVLQDFSYKLPADIDYVRAGSPNNVGLNLSLQRSIQSVATSSLFAGAQRLVNALLPIGATPTNVATIQNVPTLGLDSPTYVPTKIEISVSLLPMQSRQQVSSQFSLRDFANGNLLRGGFW